MGFAYEKSLIGRPGINVGGNPGTENTWAFAMVSAILVVIAGTLVWVCRRRWIYATTC